MGLVELIPPVEEPLTIAEAIEHLRTGESPADQALIEGAIVAARELVEQETRRALVTQTWQLTLDHFPFCDGPIRLPKPKLLGVDSIKYLDLAGNLQTLAPAGYVVDTTSIRGRITPAYGLSWPATRCTFNAVRIEFDAGFGAATDVPESLKSAMKLILGMLYENREGLIVGTIVADNPALGALLGKYKAPEF